MEDKIKAGRVPGDFVADRDMLFEAAMDPSLSDGAVRSLCIARVGKITDEDKKWAAGVLAELKRGAAA